MDAGNDDISIRSGEFIDPRREHAYRQSVLDEQLLQTRLLVWVVTGGHVTLCLVDLLFGLPHAMLIVCGGTVAAALTAIAGEAALRRRPTRETGVALIVAFAVVSLVASSLGMLARPGGADLVPARVVTALALIYLFVPFSLPLRHLLAALGAVSNFGCWLLLTEARPPAAVMVNAVVLSTVVALVGWVTAARMERIRRQKFARTSQLAAANDKLRREIDERRRIEDDLRAAKDKAEEAANAKSRFLAMMSHEVRTPMNGILGMAGLLLESRLEAEAREQAEAIRRSGEALLAVLDDILDFSKLEAGRLDIRPEPVDLRRLIDDVGALMACRAEEKGLTLAVEVGAEVPRWVETDPARLRQVLLNLVSNAVKFTHKGGVRVTVARAGGGRPNLIVTVTDTGIGISEAARGQLFTEFGQADASIARRYGGTGLGLAISKRLVELMHGRIGVESREGVGSRFWFALPVVELPGPPPADPQAQPMELRPLRVLLAEDNLINQRVAVALLERRGHAVDIVGDGAQAVAAVADGDYDVVLMDVQMPGMDGLDATRRIRALPAPRGLVPIVAMTANALRGDEERCLAAGMDAYVPKPLDVERLEHALARSVPGAAAAPAEGGQLEVLRRTFGAAYPELVQRFLLLAREHAAELAAAAERGDTSAAHRHAHALGSSAVQFGLTELAARAGEVETACRGEQREVLPGLAERVAAAVEAAAERLAAEAEAAPEPDAGAAPSPAS